MDRVAAFKAVIGPSNQDFYLSYFRRCEERGYTPLSWNWPALFWGLFWLLWRRQYRWALFTMLLGVCSYAVAGVVTEQTGSEETGMLAAYLLGLPYLAVYLPLKANGIYYDWCNQMIPNSSQLFVQQPDAQKAWLTTKGGVNQALPIIMIVWLLLVSLLAGPPPELVSQ